MHAVEVETQLTTYQSNTQCAVGSQNVLQHLSSSHDRKRLRKCCPFQKIAPAGILCFNPNLTCALLSKQNPTSIVRCVDVNSGMRSALQHACSAEIYVQPRNILASTLSLFLSLNEHFCQHSKQLLPNESGNVVRRNHADCVEAAEPVAAELVFT